MKKILICNFIVFFLVNIISVNAIETTYNEFIPTSYNVKDDTYRQYVNANGEVITKQGIDISWYQGDIDWAKVAESGIEFAIIKIGYRGYETALLNEDPQFIKNIEGAIANGIDVGIYYFNQSISIEEAKEEANWVISKLEPYKDHIKYPICADYEKTDEGARGNNLDRATLNACIATFCETVEQAGYTSAIYTDTNRYKNDLDLNLFEEKGINNIWIASYRDEPEIQGNYCMWQYTSSGSINGINGHRVDMCVSFIKEPEIEEPKIEETPTFPEKEKSIIRFSNIFNKIKANKKGE